MKRKLIIFLFLSLALAYTAFSYKNLVYIPDATLDARPIDKSKLIYERAKVLLREGNEKKAIKDLETVVDIYTASPYAEASLRKLIEIYEEREAKEDVLNLYQKLIEVFPKVEDADAIKEFLQEERMKELVEPGSKENYIEYVIQPGDSLYSIAKKHNTTVELIKKVNYLSGDIIQAGRTLRISTGNFSIFVDKTKNILILRKDGTIFKTYPVSTGRDGSTPVGTFTVVDKMIEPPWTKPGVGVIMPDSVDYELGARWIPISVQGYGIHGTNDESAIGAQNTAGCVRMRNDDVIELFDLIPRGTVVEIIDGD